MRQLFRSLLYIWIGILIIMAFIGGYLYFSLPDVTPLKTNNPETTAFMEYRQQQAAMLDKKYHIRHRWIPLKQIPRLLQRTIVVAEDASFWVHDGFDWDEVKKAIQQNWESQKIVRGASTITQQTAKNLYLTPERTFIRKLKEFFITRRLESTLTKSRILEIYLNSIEFGDGIFGIRAAAEYYFGKHPARLSVDEMVRLAAIIPNPLHLDPNEPNKELQWRSRVILDRLHKYHFIDEAQYVQAQRALERFFVFYSGAEIELR
ncbi:MAG: monofunctional biosynthetic peptidoglycan transglycosylase [Calditrichaeota bacterium]|nr:MAG: monofunctional biosynthetic peptidoglycan transglycosylase [Calditrichota bacterium]